MLIGADVGFEEVAFACACACDLGSFTSFVSFDMAAAKTGGSGTDFAPPMLREMVGAGFGASVGSGRSIGGGGVCDGVCDCDGSLKFCPGTNVKALAFSLLMLNRIRWMAWKSVLLQRDTPDRRP